MRFGTTAAMAAAAAIVALAFPAMAKDHRIDVINNTGYTIVEFYGSNSSTQEWEEDILGDDVLAPGESVVIDFDDGSGHCMFDLRAVFEDGDEVVRTGIDTCTTESFTLE